MIPIQIYMLLPLCLTAPDWKPGAYAFNGLCVDAIHLFEKVCLTTVLPAPGARKGGCELRAKLHFELIRGIHGIPG